MLKRNNFIEVSEIRVELRSLKLERLECISMLFSFKVHRQMCKSDKNVKYNNNFRQMSKY